MGDREGKREEAEKFCKLTQRKRARRVAGVRWAKQGWMIHRQPLGKTGSFDKAVFVPCGRNRFAVGCYVVEGKTIILEDLG